MSMQGRVDMLNGDSYEALGRLTRAAESLLAGLLDECTVEAEAQDTRLWDTYDVADLQEDDVVIEDDKIYGTLKYIDSGTLKDVWGPGYFICLKFSDVDESATSVSVGLRPSVSSGMAELDEDMNCVFKVTDKGNQKLKVKTTDGTRETWQTFDLNGITFAPID